jgi:hypothetical protein
VEASLPKAAALPPVQNNSDRAQVDTIFVAVPPRSVKSGPCCPRFTPPCSYPELVRYLAHRGMDVNAVTRTHGTPIYYAAMFGQLGAVKVRAACSWSSFMGPK